MLNVVHYQAKSIERLCQVIWPGSTPSKASLDKLIRILQPRLFAKGETFFEPSGEQHIVGFLDRGIIRVVHVSQDGEPCIERFFRPGACFASGLQFSKSINVTLEAETEVFAWIGDCNAYLQLLAEDHGMALGHIERVHRYLADTRQRTLELLTLDCEARYLRFAEDFAEHLDQIQQHHVANYLGMTPTQLSRIRRKLGMERRRSGEWSGHHAPAYAGRTPDQG